MSAQQENWQVVVNGEVYETDTYTLKVWIAEGRILPEDKVRKGNLNWIEANRVPSLRKIFSGEETPGDPPPPPSADAQSQPFSQNYSMPQNYSGYGSSYSSPENYGMPSGSGFQPVFNPGMPMHQMAAVCHYHPGVPPDYMCRSCGATFCKPCTKFVGNIAVCKLCGELCVSYIAATQQAMKYADRTSGFGFDEFFRSLRYPLKDKLGLVIAVIIYSFFLLGGQFGLGFISTLSSAMGFAMLFACMSLVINQVAVGRTDVSFMPDFSQVSFRESVIGPALLGIAIALVSFGPLVFLVFAVGAALREGMGSVSGLTPADMIQAGGILLAAGGIGLLWSIFYYPMALIVAGFTQDFWSVINPLVGIGAIRNMGMVYVKAFFMTMFLLGLNFGLSLILRGIGFVINIPLIFDVIYAGIMGPTTFYINLAVAHLLGLSLYKCADKLDICVD